LTEKQPIIGRATRSGQRRNLAYYGKYYFYEYKTVYDKEKAAEKNIGA